MAINLAEKYSNQIDEVMRAGALSTPGVNNEVDFVGAQTVKIYSMGTAPLNDYDPNGGMQRYGTPTELQDTIQEMTMTQQKSFTFTIDKTYAVDSPEGVRNAGKALQRQLDQVVIPAIDRYRFAKLAENAKTKTYTVLTKSNAYEAFLKANTAITDAEVPETGRVAFCSSAFIELLKLDANYTKAGDLAQDRIVFKGMVGECDGVPILRIPGHRLPAGASFIITHPIAAPAPVKIRDYKIHQDPPGLAGNLVEGLIYHDCFVFENKRVCIAVNYGTLDTLEIEMTATTSGKGKVTVSGATSGGTLVYKTGASTSAPALGADLSSWDELPADGEVSATASHKIVVALKNTDGKAVASSAAETVTVGG